MRLVALNKKEKDDFRGYLEVNSFRYPVMALYLDGAFCSYKIPLGETGEMLSVAISAGSYSDNYYASFDYVVDPFVEFGSIELGVVSKDHGQIIVAAWCNEETVPEIIDRVMKGDYSDFS